MIRSNRSGRSLRLELERLESEIVRTRAKAPFVEGTVDVQASLVFHNASLTRRVSALKGRRAALERQCREDRRLTRLTRAALDATRRKIARWQRPLSDRLPEMWCALILFDVLSVLWRIP